jgi:hypothetical protein
LQDVLHSINPEVLLLERVESHILIFEASNDFYLQLLNTISMVVHDINQTVTVLVTHSKSKASLFYLNKAHSLMMGRVISVAELIFNMVQVGDNSYKEIFLYEFKGINHELLVTMESYLHSGFSGEKTSEQLYLHRNTFRYRLNQFILLTNLDIRDFFNGLYLLYYIELTK